MVEYVFRIVCFPLSDCIIACIYLLVAFLFLIVCLHFCSSHCLIACLSCFSFTKSVWNDNKKTRWKINQLPTEVNELINRTTHMATLFSFSAAVLDNNEEDKRLYPWQMCPLQRLKCSCRCREAALGWNVDWRCWRLHNNTESQLISLELLVSQRLLRHIQRMLINCISLIQKVLDSCDI